MCLAYRRVSDTEVSNNLELSLCLALEILGQPHEISVPIAFHKVKLCDFSCRVCCLTNAGASCVFQRSRVKRRVSETDEDAHATSSSATTSTTTSSTLLSSVDSVGDSSLKVRKGDDGSRIPDFSIPCRTLLPLNFLGTFFLARSQICRRFCSCGKHTYCCRT